jgi:hypothetical protein
MHESLRVTYSNHALKSAEPKTSSSSSESPSIQVGKHPCSLLYSC